MDLNSAFIHKILFPMMERFKGNKIRENIYELEQSQNKHISDIERLSSEKLKKLLHFSIDNVTSYKNANCTHEDIDNNPLEALKKFPVLTKRRFMENSEAYISLNADRASLIPNRSGGSTSETVRFFMDRKTAGYYEAARWRGLSWWGIKPWDRSIMVWGSPLELGRNRQLVYRLKEKYLKNRIIIPAYYLKPEHISKYMRKINCYRPSYMYGYASSLHALSVLMLSKGLKLKKPLKAIVSTAETLHDFQREAIEKAFRCPVVNEYGARDAGIIAYQCKNGSMHISAENMIVETVDMLSGETVENGKPGLVLITDLNNYSMPRLRYQVGDVACLSIKPCTCGLGLPVLDKIEGREDDIFVSTDGKLIHGHFFNHIVRNLKGIRQFQAVQESRSSLALKIIKNEYFDQSEIDHFIKEIKKNMGDINIDLQFTDEIPPSPSGKFRYAIRKFPLEI